MSKLSDSILKTFYPAKLFLNNSKSINSMDIDDSGEVLMTAADDDTLNLYNCVNGKHLKTVNSKKYGCNNLIFTHANSCIVHSSNKINNDIRYLSLHDSVYLRYYSGHQDLVFDICMSPIDDTFVSVSLDKTIRLWDLRTPNSHGTLQPSTYVNLVQMDPKGLIFAAATMRKTLLLYDIRSYSRGPFTEFSIPISSKYGPPEPVAIETSTISSIEFSAEGSKIATLALNEIEAVVGVLDSFEGTVYSNISIPTPWGYIEQRSTFEDSCSKMYLSLSGTPNGNYFLAFLANQQRDLQMQAWRYENGQVVPLYDSCVNKHTCNISEAINNGYHSTITKFNHQYMMMASTCDDNLIFWQPDSDKNA